MEDTKLYETFFGVVVELQDNCSDKYSHKSFFQTQIKVPQADYEEIDHNHLWRLVIDVMKGCFRGNILSI